MNRVLTAAFFAVILLGAQAQDKTKTDIRSSGQSLTDAGLKVVLEGLGYEPEKQTSGYTIAPSKDGWVYHMQFVISDDATKIGINAILGAVPNPETVSAAQWMALLAANKDVDPSSFCFDKTTKKLFIHRALDNRAITPAYIRQQTENFISNIKETTDAWSFAK